MVSFKMYVSKIFEVESLQSLSITFAISISRDVTHGPFNLVEMAVQDHASSRIREAIFGQYLTTISIVILNLAQCSRDHIT